MTRSVSLILGILVNLDHFRHSFITQFHLVITIDLYKNKYGKVDLANIQFQDVIAKM